MTRHVWLLLVAVACGGGGSEGDDASEGKGESGSGAVPAAGPGGLSCEQKPDGTCSCAWKDSAPAKTDACFASTTPGNKSPNICCASNFAGAKIGPGYECSCAPPSVDSWTCRRTDARRACTCSASWATPLGAGQHEIPPSECGPKNGHRCGYNYEYDVCECFDDRDDNDSRRQQVDTCVTPARVIEVCPEGQTKVSSCDGNCRSETCWGSAGEECDGTGCVNRTWTCIGNRCQKI